MKTTEELQKELDALLTEYKMLKKLIEDATNSEKRYEELKPMSIWNKSEGLIAIKKQELKDSLFPIYKNATNNFYDAERIIEVNDKWIIIKTDGFYKPVNYKKDTGKRERSRNDSWSIDVKKALEIWNAWMELK
jgi:hypothetical protein